MVDERCAECASAGFPNVLAHYKAIPKGMSHDGKATPALCWDHKHGKTPRFITESKNNSLEKLVDDAHREIAQRQPETVPKKLNCGKAICACGCGTEFIKTGPRSKFIAGHKPERANPTKITTAIESRKVVLSTAPRRRPMKNLSLTEVLVNLKTMLGARAAELQRNQEAVETVLVLIQQVEKVNTAAEFCATA